MICEGGVPDCAYLIATGAKSNSGRRCTLTVPYPTYQRLSVFHRSSLDEYPLASPRVKVISGVGEGLRVCRFCSPDLGVGVGEECSDASDSTSVVFDSSSSSGRETVDIESGGVLALGPGDEDEVRLVEADTV